MKNSSASALGRFVSARLSTEGYVGLYLTVGLVLMVIAGSMFAELAGDVVTGGSITRTDVWLAVWFHLHATPALTYIMLAFTHLHGTAGILLMAVLFGFYLAYNKERYWLLTVVSTMSGGMLLNVALKHVFQRTRPSFDEPLLTLTTYSFPSGHTAGSTLFYGVLAAFLVSRTTRMPVKLLIGASAGTMILITGLSRMYLGVHYLSDVLAATMSSCAWLALCITVVSSLRRRRLQQVDPVRR